MLDRLGCTCEGDGCDRRLGEEQWRLSMTTPDGARHVYECTCGEVTVTVAASNRDPSGGNAGARGHPK